MHFLITGATGFIGRALVQRLLLEQHQVSVLTRNKQRAEKLFGGSVHALLWDGVTVSEWAEQARGATVVVNLAGENIGQGRWTQKRKERILNSRVKAGQALCQAILQWEQKPAVFFQASATGYYGNTGEEIVDESAPPGEGFLARVCQAWENTTRPLEEQGIRRVVMRTGVVLGQGGGLMAKMLPPFRFFLGGPLGSGQQWLPWIHLQDVVGAILFLLNREDQSGPFNLTAPEPVRLLEFCRTLASLMHRPCWLKVPAFALRLLFGEMADEAILASQRVVPARLVQAGYPFVLPQLRMALAEVLGRQYPGA